MSYQKHSISLVQIDSLLFPASVRIILFSCLWLQKMLSILQSKEIMKIEVIAVVVGCYRELDAVIRVAERNGMTSRQRNFLGKVL